MGVAGLAGACGQRDGTAATGRALAADALPTFGTDDAPAGIPSSVPDAAAGQAAPRVSFLAGIAEAAQEEIAAGRTPGAVVLVGQHGRVVYRQAFGDRMVDPVRQPMTDRTVFDVASLTKVVATAPAVVQLADRGRLRLDDPVARHWPEFGQNGKDGITIRQLLTHFSGLRVGMPAGQPWSGRDGALTVIAADRTVAAPGTKFSYSDVDFIVLGEVVRRVSGMELDAYCAHNLFGPLGMRSTGFNPGPDLRDRIAPSNVIEGELRWGQVQDPIAYRMGGVAGHAGLFSTADDLALFMEMVRHGGVGASGARVLSAGAVQAMTTPQGPAGNATLRGLGWDIRSGYSADFSPPFSPASFGHTGYTGTSIWFDPALDGYAIILANRLHPDGRGNVRPLRARVSQVVASALARPVAALPDPMGRAVATASAELGGATLFPASVRQVHPHPNPLPPAGEGALVVPVAARGSLLRPLPVATVPAATRPTAECRAAPPRNGVVKTGIDVLAECGFAPLAGRRVGLITNHTGLDAAGRRTVDVLARAPNLRLAALFSPEHGLSGTLDEKVGSTVDPATGLVVHSLYGATMRPTPEMLAGLDTLVFDIQDAGVRYYTYITTLAYAMEAAARSGIQVVVLDRPNPLNAAAVQGPVMEPGLRSFAGYFPLPTRHGMTVGEIARLFNQEARIGADLLVVPMAGYRREAWFDATGRPWVNPSPNLRSLIQATLYAGVGMVEGANVSVGRGTATPFEVLGAPWINGAQLAEYLNARRIPGVRFRPVTFTPTSSAYRGRPCEGVRIELTDRDALDAPALGIELVAALHRLYGGTFRTDQTAGMVGSRAVVQQVQAGADPAAVRASWQPELARFHQLRRQYLIYP